MKIRVNGQEREVPADLTLYQLMAELGLDPEQRGIALAVDGEVVFRRYWKDQHLQHGSQVEIVRAVAGGR